MADAARLLTVGRVSGLYGVAGWVRIHSHTEPRENILRYVPWRLQLQGRWLEARVLEGRRLGKGVIARLDLAEDRDAARRLLGALIAVQREQLPVIGEDEVYWADLEGLRVETASGQELGRVDHLIETPSNDVLVVRGDRERLIPYLPGEVVLDVDLARGRLRVDWDPDF